MQTQTLATIREQQDADETSYQLKQFCRNGWPPKHKLKGDIKKFWAVSSELSVEDGLLLRGSRLVIPTSMQAEILHKLHLGHLGITKCRERACSAVWWPGITSQLQDKIEQCSICNKQRPIPVEPLLPTVFPSRLWQTLGTDLFEWRGKSFLLVVDYYSRYPEVVSLSSTSSKEVIDKMKAMFARHGIPDEVRSDNGPQYASDIFAKFAKKYDFVHTTSSPRYPQSNGEAERMVQTMKKLLMKSDDPYQGLLSYRSAPLSNGYSPAELLMGRQLRSFVPTTLATLLPKRVPYRDIQVKEQVQRQKTKERFDKHHRVKELPPLSQGEKVWIPDRTERGSILQQSKTPRSYTVAAPSEEFRRNRRHIVRDHQQKEPVPEDQKTEMKKEEPTESTVQHPPSIQAGLTTTRSGRAVKPPQKLDL